MTWYWWMLIGAIVWTVCTILFLIVWKGVQDMNHAQDELARKHYESARRGQQKKEFYKRHGYEAKDEQFRPLHKGLMTDEEKFKHLEEHRNARRNRQDT